MGTSESQSHKRIGRSARGFDNAIWERERENAVFAGTFAKFSQNPEMKHHLLGTVNNLLAEASPFDQGRGIALRADNPDAHEPPLVARKELARAGSFYRPRPPSATIRTGRQHPSSSPQVCTPL